MYPENDTFDCGAGTSCRCRPAGASHEAGGDEERPPYVITLATDVTVQEKTAAAELTKAK